MFSLQLFALPEPDVVVHPEVRGKVRAEAQPGGVGSGLRQQVVGRHQAALHRAGNRRGRGRRDKGSCPGVDRERCFI